MSLSENIYLKQTKILNNDILNNLYFTTINLYFFYYQKYIHNYHPIHWLFSFYYIY